MTGTSIWLGFTSTFSRSLTIDIPLMLDWFNYENISYENESDNRKATATTLYTVIDLCNKFRDTLKPASNYSEL